MNKKYKIVVKGKGTVMLLDCECENFQVAFNIANEMVSALDRNLDGDHIIDKITEIHDNQ